MYFKDDNGQSSDDYMRTYNVFRVGDIAFEGHKNKNFAYGRFVENTIGNGIVSHVFDVFRPITDYDLSYWKYAIHNEKSMRPVLAKSTTKATMMNNLVAKDFLKQSLRVPNLAEQKKIGKLLTKIDTTLDLRQRRIAELEKVKNAYLAKLFPGKDQHKPAIRFDSFSGDWIEKTLGAIGSTYSGLSGKTKDDFGHGEAKFVTYMNVFSNPITSLNSTDSVEIDTKQNEVNYGDVLFTTSSETPGEVGMSSVWLGQEANIYLNSFCFGYRLNNLNDVSPYYLAYLLRASRVRRNIILLAQGISRYNISKNKMMDISIPLPKLPEQKKIGYLLNLLDRNITLRRHQVSKLKKLKASYLTKMFVS